MPIKVFFKFWKKKSLNNESSYGKLKIKKNTEYTNFERDPRSPRIKRTPVKKK